MTSPTDTLRAALVSLDGGRFWMQGDDETARRQRADTAVWRAGDWARDEVRLGAIAALARAVGYVGSQDDEHALLDFIARWNDEAGRTWEDVQAAFDLAIRSAS